MDNVNRPFIPANHAARVQIVYQTSNHVMENNLFVRGPDNLELLQLVDIRDATLNWLDYQWKNVIHEQVQVTRIITTALHKPDAPQDDWILGPPITGRVGGELDAINVSFPIKITSGLAGRSTRGRIFVPGIPTQYRDTVYSLQPNIAATYATTLFLWQGYLNAIAWPAQWVICSFRNNRAWRTEAQLYDVVACTYTNTTLASQRRRLKSLVKP